MIRTGTRPAGQTQDRLLVIFSILVLAACVAGRLHLGSSPAVMGVAFAAVALAIWHGAYDGVTAHDLLWPRLHRRWWVVFFGMYAVLLAAGALLWWTLPAVALALFLLYASWHFGTERSEGAIPVWAGVGLFAQGALPIAAACHWRAEEVLPIFAGMLREPHSHAPAARHILAVAGNSLWPLVAFALAGVWTDAVRRRSWRIAATATLLMGEELLLFYMCPPLMAFAVFFCIWHTPQHLLESSSDRRGTFSPRRLLRNLRGGFLPWVITLAALGGALLLDPSWLDHASSALFVLLSVLTVPHMVLHEVRRRSLGWQHQPAVAQGASA